MATYAQFLALSCQQALAGVNSLTSPVLDIEMTAETLVPTIFQQVALEAAADPDKQSLLRRTHTIALTNGVGTLPDEALTQCLNNASFNDPADFTIGPTVSLVPQWFDFVGSLDTRLGYWTVKGDNSFHYTEPNASYSPTSGFTGNIELTIPSVPVIPATSATTLDVPDEIFSDLVAALSQALRGQIQKAA